MGWCLQPLPDERFRIAPFVHALVAQAGRGRADRDGVHPTPAPAATAPHPLSEAASRFDQAFELGAVGMALVAVDDHRILRANGRWVDLLGWTEEELLGMTNEDLTHPDDVAASASRKHLLLDRAATSLQAEKRVRCADGSFRWFLVSVSLIRDEAGEPLFVLSQLQDIHAQKLAEAELARQAHVDPLTGLANRSRFLDRLAAAMARIDRSGERLGVLFVDLDGFKAVNDRDGHAAGDAVLVAVAQRLADAVRPGDTVARFGGDEFLVLCDPLVDPASLAARIEAAVVPVGMGASVGAVVVEPRDARSAGAVVEAADAAMYAVKRARRPLAAEPASTAVEPT